MLTLNHVNKSFGSKQVLFDVSFNVRSGLIWGLIGKNGAGKTTIFHSILNLANYTGDIWLDKKMLNAQDYERIGYLPEERSLMPKLTVFDQISFLASLKGLSTKEIKTRLPEWMDKLEVNGKITDKISSLSKGNQQKIQLIATLIHQPKLIILDEPFSGLDPINVDLMRKIILEEKTRGAIIIFSDHNMSNVETLCDDVVMLRKGKVVLNGAVNDIRNQFGATRLFIRTKKTADELKNLVGVSEVRSLINGSYRLILSDAKYGAVLFEQLTQGKYIQTFDQEPPTLSEIFKMKESR